MTGLRVVKWFEGTFFGGYTGTPEARREFARRDLLGRGYSREIVDRVLREEDAQKVAQGVTW